MKKRRTYGCSGKRSAIRRRWLRSLLRKQRKRHLAGGRKIYASLRKRRGRVAFVRLRSPDTLGLQGEPRVRFIRFLRELRNVALQGGNGVIVDFSQTVRIYPAGGLLLVAELDRIKKLVPNGALLSCKGATQDSLPDQVLTQIGVYKALGYSTGASPSDQTVVHWRTATGLKAAGEEAGPLLENCDGELAPALRTSLYRGITEAMTNAVQHAYLGPRRDGSNCHGEKRWWLFSQQRDGVLYVVFCDLGIGIPASLPIVNTGVKKILAGFARNRSDVEAIRLATELGKTSTAQPNRGKGLPEILDAARKSAQGACVIYSNRGQFGFDPGGTEVEKQYSDSILGTLIEWRVPISEGTNDEQ